MLHQEPLRDSAIRSIVWRYYVLSACYVFGPLFIFAVYPLFLRARGLNQLQINVVVAAFVLMTFLTDVPTGAFADAVGRRAAVLAAGVAGERMWFALGAVMTALFAQGVLGPMAFAWYNEMIAGENRATLLSFGTTMSTLGGIIGLPVQGKMVDAFGTAATWRFAGALSMTSIACYVALARSPVVRDDLPSI